MRNRKRTAEIIDVVDLSLDLDRDSIFGWWRNSLFRKRRGGGEIWKRGESVFRECYEEEERQPTRRKEAGGDGGT